MKSAAALILVAAVGVAVVALPRPAAPATEPCEIQITIPEQPAPIVNVTVPESAAPIVTLTVPESSPIVNVTVPELPAPIVNVEQAATPPPQVVYEDREVIVEKVVEIPACIDFADLPYFDLANALTVAFPGEPWSLNGSYYPGLTWHGEGPKPDMTAIVSGWLQHLEAACVEGDDS